MLTIAITAAGSGIGQPVIDSLRQASLQVRLVGLEASPWGRGAYECDTAYLFPLANDPAYKTHMMELCERVGIDVLIPGSDPELIPIAEMGSDLASRGTAAIVGSAASIRLCRDKLAMSQYMIDRSIPFVQTWSLDDARAQAANLPYPLIVKERSGSGSVGAQVLSSPQDWDRIHCQGAWIVQPYLLSAGWYHEQRGLQPYLERLERTGRPVQQDEISTQVLVSPQGELVSHFISVNRLKDGVPMQVDPIDDGQVWPDVHRLVDALIELGLRGPCNVQGRWTPEGMCFFEVNPRFTGITHVRALMGYNEVEAAVRLFALGEAPQDACRCLAHRTDCVGLRQMSEIVVPRERLERLTRDRYLPEA
jgi:carbamoylphosphate synthase large subunit